MTNMRYHSIRAFEDSANLEFEDDGGAEKGNERRLRRSRRQKMSFIIPTIVICALFYFRASHGDVTSSDTTTKNVKAAELVTNVIGRVTRRVGGVETKNKPIKEAKNSIPHHRYRWADKKLLPPLPGTDDNKDNIMWETFQKAQKKLKRNGRQKKEFKLTGDDDDVVMSWESDADDETTHPKRGGPRVDYTNATYSYPDIKSYVMRKKEGRHYPILEPLGDILKRWPQDQLDAPPVPIVERLLHFDYSDPEQRQMAVELRDGELPFKVYNVPEIDMATKKWTDEYLISHFDVDQGDKEWKWGKDVKPRSGHCQESLDNFFPFFRKNHWDVSTMGRPPTMEKPNWTFRKWAKHARYADRTGLPPYEKHYYWQSGVPPDEQFHPELANTFVSRDLPSFSDPDTTFFVFNPDEQKGIQCRFGERGVTAATHYDGGRNMVAMITGAKRYILAPPKECPKIGIVTHQKHPTYRHSMLNFAHLDLLEDESPEAKEMPQEEREWLKIAKDSLAIDTVLKAGEVLYIPSHWFHYITSLQKSAQCNARSGKHIEGTERFGGYQDVADCIGSDTS